MKKIKAPFSKSAIKDLKAGDEILLSGVIFTARDQAHKRLDDLIKKGKKLPVDLKGACIYYAGPTPARPGMAIGSCGPTTSSRMDIFTPKFIERGLIGMIGKGERSKDVKNAIKKHGAIYFIATGGLGALLSTKIKRAKIIAFSDLGPEAIHRLEVEDFPLIVGIDPKGRDIYGKAKWKKA
jgi:fumarate hydratase subunit beta